MKFCLNASVSFAPSSRAITSELPPGGNGTTMVTGFDGYGCACAGSIAISPNDKNRSSNRGIFMYVRMAGLLSSRTTAGGASLLDGLLEHGSASVYGVLLMIAFI